MDEIKISSSKNNKNIFINNENPFLEYELSKLIEKKRKELNIQYQNLKMQKLELEQIKNNLKIELSKINKIIKHKIMIEKEIEKFEVNLSKIKKKKLYNMSSIIKLKNLFKTSNIVKKYLFLLNIGLEGEKMNSEYLDLIIEDEDDDEFLYYLKYLEKQYITLEKENEEKFINYKKIIMNYLENDNLSYPNDKLLLYLNYIIQNIELSKQLKEKYEKLKNIESKKNIIDIKIRNLELNKTEKKNYIKDINSYIELLKDILQQYIYYQNQYKNNLISKDKLYKKIKKIQSINIQQWNPENKNKNKNYLNKNKKLKNYTTIQKTKFNILTNNKSAIFINFNKNDNIFTKFNHKYESKSQNISRNLSVDYLSKIEGPLCKKSSIEKMDISYNDMFNSVSINDSEENISENIEDESPITNINITTRKKNTINVYKKKLSVPFLNSPISLVNNNFNSISKNTEIQKTNSKMIYKSKNNSLNNIIKTNSTSRTYKEIKDSLESDTITQNKEINNQEINNNKQIKNNDEYNIKKKGLYFIKKIKKNKKFIINKDKLFNNHLPIKINSYSDKNTNIFNNTKNIKSNQGIKKIYQKDINKGRQSFSQNKDNIYINNNGGNVFNRITFYNNDSKLAFLNDLNYKENKDIKNIFYEINSKKCNDSIKAIRDEMKKRNFLSINRGSTLHHGVFKKNEIKADFKNDNCCISCT